MPSRSDITEFLSQRHLAFVGVSRDPEQFANAVYRELREHGRTLYPVNSGEGADLIEGDRCYDRLAVVPDPVDGVVVMVPAAAAADVVRDAIARGIRRVWLHRGVGPGSVSHEAVDLCRQNNMLVVDGACPFMFDEPVHSVHRLHRVVAARRFVA